VILGMVLGELGQLQEAEAAYRRAIELASDDQVAHHNLGALLARMERPEAIDSLDQAARLGAGGFESAFSRGLALLNAFDLEGAEREFARAVELRPEDAAAQLNLARIRYQRGDEKFARDLATATAAHREDVTLQLLFGEVLWRAGNLPAAETVLRELLVRKGPNPAVQSLLSAVLLEAGMLKEAEGLALEAAAALPEDQTVLMNLVSVLLSRERAADAEPFIAAQLRRDPRSVPWLAYEATAARLLGRDRYRELYDYDRVVRVFDLEAPPGFSSMAEFNQALLKVLDDRHRFRNHPLDQSLRNGTQTTRSLLTDSDPLIRSVIKAFDEPIAEYRSRLGVDPGHPLSAGNVGDSRFTGAWSVCLRRNGFHVNHFHPDGLISSAYYVDVPAETRNEQLKSGWIKFGEPRYPVPGAGAERFVQPKPGRLVLFPSYMWHGTNAILGAEPRTCIAFDVRPERP
jgi:Flp pilus assembly protein TadD